MCWLFACRNVAHHRLRVAISVHQIWALRKLQRLPISFSIRIRKRIRVIRLLIRLQHIRIRVVRPTGFSAENIVNKRIHSFLRRHQSNQEMALKRDKDDEYFRDARHEDGQLPQPPTPGQICDWRMKDRVSFSSKIGDSNNNISLISIVTCIVALKFFISFNNTYF
jgi:hypothetical protein